jgi:hypothetical protein
MNGGKVSRLFSAEWWNSVHGSMERIGMMEETPENIPSVPPDTAPFATLGRFTLAKKATC